MPDAPGPVPAAPSATPPIPRATPAEYLGKAFGIAWFGSYVWLNGQSILELAGAALAGSESPHLLQQLATKGSNLLFLVLVVFAYLMRPGARRKARGATARIVAFLGAFLFPGLVSLSPGIAALWPAARPFVLDAQPAPGPLVVGTALFVMGYTTAFVVMFWLGRSFSVMPEARGLVMRGPYTTIRHPLYLCENIAGIGLALQYDTALAYGGLAAHLALQLARMHYEEKVLAAEFPEYAAYRDRTWRLVPGVY